MSYARSVAAVLLFITGIAVLVPTPRRVEAEAQAVSSAPPTTLRVAVRSGDDALRSTDEPDHVTKLIGFAPPKLPFVLPAFAPVVGTLDPRIRAGYELASAGASKLWPGCGLRWTILAGVGSIESANGTHHDGAIVVSDSGLVLPRIVGPALDGQDGRSLIADSDSGLLDGDATVDHAVGPMQFIPSTWLRHGRDANDDGLADPHSIDDAALAAASYLCAAGDLRDEETLRRALFSYNHSDDYVIAVRYQIEQFDLAFGLLAPSSTVTDPPSGSTTSPFSVPPPGSDTGGGTENGKTTPPPATTAAPPSTTSPTTSTTSTTSPTTMSTSTTTTSTSTTSTSTTSPTTTTTSTTSTTEAPTTAAPATTEGPTTPTAPTTTAP